MTRGMHGIVGEGVLYIGFTVFFCGQLGASWLYYYSGILLFFVCSLR